MDPHMMEAVGELESREAQGEAEEDKLIFKGE